MAKAVFSHLMRERGLENAFAIDSAGTGSWHIGDPPDPRAVDATARHGIRLENRGRQLEPADLGAYDLILTMDRSNYRDVKALARTDEEAHRVKMFRDFDPDGSGEVPDPYYGGDGGFEKVFRMIKRTSNAILDRYGDHG
jgi:protein-tyrosine phosphatase